MVVFYTFTFFILLVNNYSLLISYHILFIYIFFLLLIFNILFSRSFKLFLSSYSIVFPIYVVLFWSFLTFYTYLDLVYYIRYFYVLLSMF